ncbi:hypothetical protein [Actinoplanes xinjiangensis]|uniref:hypothetical protein n=1 Tax=Actinoplanes xinjiangensis TaxID=512350 RepID=UPI0011B639C5|nr:hypothetical protein [Actinoplanes xinjiangensis]
MVVVVVGDPVGGLDDAGNQRYEPPEQRLGRPAFERPVKTTPPRSTSTSTVALGIDLLLEIEYAGFSKAEYAGADPQRWFQRRWHARLRMAAERWSSRR